MSDFLPEEVIERFLNGEDDEKYIVSVEYNYRDNQIYKIIQDPEKGKVIRKDKFTPYLWVGDLTGYNFYKNSKTEQRKKMKSHGISIKPLDTHGNERLENGLKYMVKCSKSYTNLTSFFREGGIDPWSDEYRHLFVILNPVEQYLIQKTSPTRILNLSINSFASGFPG